MGLAECERGVGSPGPCLPQAEPDRILDSHVLRLVVMSLLVGGTLVVLSGVLLLCKRCWEVHPRLNRCVDPHPAAFSSGEAGST